VLLPQTAPYSNHTYHQFVIRCGRRDELKRFLSAAGIETQIHYENAPFLSPIYAPAPGVPALSAFSAGIHREVLSLPIYPGLTEEELSFVIQTVNAF